MAKQAQWFPGHIAKTLKNFQNHYLDLDAFFILLDARAPYSSFLPQFENIYGNKQCIIVLTKIDLVEPNDLKYWIDYYKKKFNNVICVNLKNKNETESKLKEILNKMVFKSLLPKFAVLGIPNVGKSTLINLLANKKTAKVENRAGVTKSNSWFMFGKKYWILDSPGILEPKFENSDTFLKLAIIGSIKLEILPIREIADFLFDTLTQTTNDFKTKNKEEFFKSLAKNNQDIDEIYLKFIKHFQNQKFGKLIIDKNK